MKRAQWQRMDLSEHAQIWEQWRSGRNLGQIARKLNRARCVVRGVVERAGGFAPPIRKRRATQMTLRDREEIFRGICAGSSARHIAESIGKHHSSVSREIERNGGRAAYRPSLAEKVAWDRGLRPKTCLLRQRPRLRAYVDAGLRRWWSPEQISARLEQYFPDDQSMRVSHETIYRTLFIQSRGALKKELTQFLRTKRKVRQACNASSKRQGRGQIVDAVSISERPAEVADRAVPGHWEGDLISGSNNSYIATLVERHSRYVLLAKVSSKETLVVVQALSEKMKKLPQELRRSLTWDNGKELAAHKAFTIATDMQVYFCDPHSPWQRGSNENTNGLLRQFFPKRTDLSEHSQGHLNKIAKLMNQRPRETLGFRTPAEKLSETVALTL